MGCRRNGVRFVRGLFQGLIIGLLFVTLACTGGPSTETASDMTTVPADGATDVPLDTEISVTFGSSISPDAGSISADSIRLSSQAPAVSGMQAIGVGEGFDPGGDVLEEEASPEPEGTAEIPAPAVGGGVTVVSEISYDTTNKQLLISPQVPLQPNTTYTVTLGMTVNGGKSIMTGAATQVPGATISTGQGDYGTPFTGVPSPPQPGQAGTPFTGIGGQAVGTVPGGAQPAAVETYTWSFTTGAALALPVEPDADDDTDDDTTPEADPDDTTPESEPKTCFGPEEVYDYTLPCCEGLGPIPVGDHYECRTEAPCNDDMWSPDGQWTLSTFCKACPEANGSGQSTPDHTECVCNTDYVFNVDSGTCDVVSDGAAYCADELYSSTGYDTAPGGCKSCAPEEIPNSTGESLSNKKGCVCAGGYGWDAAEKKCKEGADAGPDADQMGMSAAEIMSIINKVLF